MAGGSGIGNTGLEGAERTGLAFNRAGHAGNCDGPRSVDTEVWNILKIDSL